MREIKFRAWHFGQNLMYDAATLARDQLTMLTTGEFINVSSVSQSLSVLIPTNQMLPLQFTGLRDMHGEEIYEGDIIQLHEYGEVLKEVVFHKGAFCIHGFNWNVSKSEVRGNIYENGHLIGKP